MNLELAHLYSDVVNNGQDYIGDNLFGSCAKYYGEDDQDLHVHKMSMRPLPLMDLAEISPTN